MSGDTIGMMEGAFFVGRNELLQWANELLDLNLTKIEQWATGAVYAQILDAIYPGTFSLSKINWQAKHEHEFVNNYKVLQSAFKKNGITRYIEVEKLVKAKYQDNLEFMQWLKRYFELNYNGEPYDAVGKRKGAELFYINSWNKPVGLTKPSTGAAKKPTKPTSSTAGSGAPKKVFTKPSAPSAGAAVGGTSAGPGAQKKIQELEGEIAELKLTSDTLEKERDFYFGKLRDIEVLLQAYQEQGIPAIDLVLKILYATEDEKVEVDENGNLNITQATGGGEGVAEEDPQNLGDEVMAEDDGQAEE